MQDKTGYKERLISLGCLRRAPGSCLWTVYTQQSSLTATSADLPLLWGYTLKLYCVSCDFFFFGKVQVFKKSCKSFGWSLARSVEFYLAAGHLHVKSHHCGLVISRSGSPSSTAGYTERDTHQSPQYISFLKSGFIFQFLHVSQGTFARTGPVSGQTGGT